jgi:hypothetical protein
MKFPVLSDNSVIGFMCKNSFTGGMVMAIGTVRRIAG